MRTTAPAVAVPGRVSAVVRAGGAPVSVLLQLLQGGQGAARVLRVGGRRLHLARCEGGTVASPTCGPPTAAAHEGYSLLCACLVSWMACWIVLKAEKKQTQGVSTVPLSRGTGEGGGPGQASPKTREQSHWQQCETLTDTFCSSTPVM